MEYWLEWSNLEDIKRSNKARPDAVNESDIVDRIKWPAARNVGFFEILADQVFRLRQIICSGLSLVSIGGDCYNAG